MFLFFILADMDLAEMYHPAVRPIFVFLSRKIVYDLNQPIRRRFGVKASLFWAWFVAGQLGAFAGFAVTYMRDVIAFSIYLSIDFTFFCSKFLGPAPVLQNNGFMKVYRKVMTHGRPLPPQGSDVSPYPVRSFRMYELLLDGVGVTVGLLAFLFTSMITQLPLLTGSAAVQAKISYAPSGYSFVFLGVAFISSLIQDRLVRMVSQQWLGHSFDGLFNNMVSRTRWCALWSLFCGNSYYTRIIGSSLYIMSVGRNRAPYRKAFNTDSFSVGETLQVFMNAPGPFGGPAQSLRESLSASNAAMLPNSFLVSAQVYSVAFQVLGPFALLSHFGPKICLCEKKLGRDGVQE